MIAAPASENKDFTLACIRCGAEYPGDLAIDSRGCLRCAPEAPANLAVRYTVAFDIDMTEPERKKGQGMSRFAAFLPVASETMVRLGEGDTPLVAVPQLGQHI